MNEVVSPIENAELIVRTEVSPAAHYSDYRQVLRRDFLYMCAYCQRSEAEAPGMRYAIDHYEPRAARPELTHVYSNLMWSCDECNMLKGDRCPPPEARQAGMRFFRPDQDIHGDHFESIGIRIKGKTATGEYSEDTLELNRLSLRKLREIRQKLGALGEEVTAGILALRSFPMDELQQMFRARAYQTVSRLEDQFLDQIEVVDDLLREFSKSPYLDKDEEPGEAVDKAAKAARQKNREALFAGEWRTPKRKAR